MVDVIEFQTAVTNSDPMEWESLIRFALVDDRVHVVAADDAATQGEVASILDEIYQETLLRPDDGARFLAAVAIWDDGTRYARVTRPAPMPAEQALAQRGLVSADLDADVVGEESMVELIGHVQRELAQLTRTS